MYSKVLFVYFGMAVYCFCSVGKMENFQFGLLDFVVYHGNVQNLMSVVRNFVVVKMNDYAGFLRRFRCL